MTTPTGREATASNTGEIPVATRPFAATNVAPEGVATTNHISPSILRDTRNGGAASSRVRSVGAHAV